MDIFDRIYKIHKIKEEKLRQGITPTFHFVNLVNPVETERTFAAFFGDTTLTDLSKTSPAILIVPADNDIAGADVAPPFFKLFARNVERRWRN